MVIHLPKTIVPISAPYSHQLQESFVQSCIHLHTAPMRKIVAMDEVFEDLPMNDFLTQLEVLFLNRRKLLSSITRDWFFTEEATSNCNGCTAGAKVKTFTYYDGDGRYIAKADLAYNIVWKEGILIDIYRCLLYQGCNVIKLCEKNQNLPTITFSYDAIEHAALQRKLPNK